MRNKIILLSLLFIISFGAGIGYYHYLEFRKANFHFDGHWIASSEFKHLKDPFLNTSQAYISNGTALFHDYYSTTANSEPTYAYAHLDKKEPKKYFTSTERSLFHISKHRLAMRMEMQQASKHDLPKPKNNLSIAYFHPLNNSQFFIKFRSEDDEELYFLYNKQS